MFVNLCRFASVRSLQDGPLTGCQQAASQFSSCRLVVGTSGLLERDHYRNEGQGDSRGVRFARKCGMD